MDAGQVGEYGSPRELLKNPKSLFSQLIAAEQQQERDGGFKKVDRSKENDIMKKSNESNKAEVEKDSRTNVLIPMENLEALIDANDASESKIPIKTLR